MKAVFYDRKNGVEFSSEDVLDVKEGKINFVLVEADKTIETDYSEVIFLKFSEGKVLENKRLPIQGEEALTQRTKNALSNMGVHFVDQLTLFTSNDYLAERNFGIVSFNEVVKLAEKYNKVIIGARNADGKSRM